MCLKIPAINTSLIKAQPWEARDKGSVFLLRRTDRHGDSFGVNSAALGTWWVSVAPRLCQLPVTAPLAQVPFIPSVLTHSKYRTVENDEKYIFYYL